MSRKRNSFLTIAAIMLIFVVMWLFAGWNVENADLDNYRIRYDYSDYDTFKSLDIGFYYVLKFFYDFKLSFESFHIIIYGIGLLVLSTLTYKWSRWPVVVLLIYISYKYVRDVVEMRNFLASLMLLVTLPFVGLKDKKDRCLLILGLFFSCTMHISFLPFWILLFVYRNTKIKQPWLYIAVFFVASFVFLSLADFSSLLGMERLEDKLEGQLSEQHLGHVASFIVISFNMLIIQYFSKLYDKNIRFGSEVNFYKPIPVKQYNTLVFNINVLSSVLITFSAVNYSFTGRLFGVIVLLNVVYLTNYFALAKQKGIVEYALLVGYVIYIIQFYSMENSHTEAVLTNNSFFIHSL